MSEVKRYFADLISAYDTVPIENIHDVQVVLATDYAALEAERDSLKNSLLAITTRHFAEGWKRSASDKQLEQYLSAGIAQLEAERDAALAECERLRELLRGFTELGIAATNWPEFDQALAAAEQALSAKPNNDGGRSDGKCD